MHSSRQILPPDKQVDESDPLTWDSSYAIALALMERFPNIDLEEVSLEMIFQWTTSLPEFIDDPNLANDQILMAVYQEWYEETYPV